MTSPVLCAVDIGHTSQERAVLARAAQLAELDGAQLDLVTVVPDFGASIVSDYFKDGHMDAMREDARKRLNDFAAEVLGEEQNASIRHIISTGTAYEEILKAAKAAGSGLIVMGAHKPGFTDYLLGPNAARVSRHADASVYIVRT
ncbi:MAG: universal stress protein [Pseudomonadota bacterium]